MTKVYRVMDIQLREGVKAEDYEKFIIEEWQPYPKLREGLSYFGVLKEEKGPGEGKYQMVWVYDSVEARDLYKAGQLPYTADQELIETRAALTKKARDMVTFTMTDYVLVGG